MFQINNFELRKLKDCFADILLLENQKVMEEKFSSWLCILVYCIGT